MNLENERLELEKALIHIESLNSVFQILYLIDLDESEGREGSCFAERLIRKTCRLKGRTRGGMSDRV